jgi:hypothetical protein
MEDDQMDRVVVPLKGELRPQQCPDPEPGEPVLVFDIEIPVHFALTSPVEPGLFSGRKPVARVSLEEVDLGVSDWRDLTGMEIAIPPELDQSDAAIYLGGVHNPVRLNRIRFGAIRGRAIRAALDLEIDLSCVNPRPPELGALLKEHWEIDLEIVTEDDDEP